jgi:hypothetical protein
MSEVIEHGANDNIDSVRVGESSAVISAKAYQDIYHQITGRTEQIRKRYSQNLLVEFSELEQLHHKIMQLCDVHNIVARNEVVSIFHEKERKDQFTSFERFRTYNANSSSPTVNVVLKYNFSIIPAGLEKTQEYVVTVRLSSRVAMLEQIESDAPPFVRGRIFRYLTGNTAEITVEYADYIIARGFLEAFDEWVRGCKAEPDVLWLLFSQRWSHLTPMITKLATALVTISYAVLAIPSFFGAVENPPEWARFFIVFIGGFYIITNIAGVAGGLIEESIDNMTVISYLNLNKGDKKLIDKFKRRKFSMAMKFVLGCLLTVLLGFISSQLAELV